MGCEREQKQPSEHWQTLGWSRKSTGTQKQHTPPESAYRLGLDSNLAAWVFRQLWWEAQHSALSIQPVTVLVELLSQISRSSSNRMLTAECRWPFFRFSP